MKDKILFVVQRYGEEVNGGAEMEARGYAEHLVGKYNVEVLTTCAVDYISWNNYYPEGDTSINGVFVHRYLNDRPRSKNFDKLSEKVIRPDHTYGDEQAWIDAQGPVCTKAIKWLREHYREYRAVLFMTYLYYLTARGLAFGMDNSILIPTAHDEWPIHLKYYRQILSAPVGIIYNTEDEREFVESTFRTTQNKPSCTVGYGIEIPQNKLPDVKKKYKLCNYILYAGRIDVSKGCRHLFDYFQEYKRRHKESDLQLVLCGKSAMEVPKDKDIISLGFVSEADKYALMKEAHVFVIASLFESLSIVVLESMAMGTPVLVNGACTVLKDHCIDSNAGLWFTNYTQFEKTLDFMLYHPDCLAKMKENGKRYVSKNYRWDHIVDKIDDLIKRL